MVLPFENMDYGVDEVGARNIPELTDVELTNLANGEILKYNSSNNKWENQPESGVGSIDNLTDTNITIPITNGSSLVYNTSNGKWENTLLVDIDTLNNLSDTNISSLADKDFLLYDNTSSKWINTPSIIDNLKNVNILSIANNEVLKYNSTSQLWENNNLLINEIQDVNITSLQNGEVLKYNSGSGKWENQDNTDTLNELTDVTLTGSSNNQVLKYNGSIWVNNFVNLTELADTNISTLNNGDILRYNSVSQKWETDTFNIDDLDNVNITSLQNNEILKYNTSTGKWENSNRIDTLDELGDVTLTSVTTGDLLRYNGSIFVNTKIALDNDFTNVNFTSLTNGDLIKYNGFNFVNFSPTYLDGAGISDNYLIKVVSGATTQTSITETNTTNTTTITFNNGSIETEIFNTTKKRMHLTTGGISSTNGITITSDGRVGIGIVEPEEDLEVDGSIQIDSANVARLKFQKSGPSPHALAEIDGEGDGTNGGQLEFYTKVDGGSVSEKLRINNKGAIGIKGADYGTAGQVLTSNGSGSAVSWENQTDTTYSAGTGLNLVGTTFNNTAPDQIVSLTGSGSTTITGTYPNFTISSTGGTTYSAGTGLNLVGTTFNNTAPDQIVSLTGSGSTTITGTYPNFTISSTGGATYTGGTGVTISPSNVISIGQSVANSNSPNFTQMSLGNTGVSQGILNLQDFTNTGTDTIAQIKGIKEGTNGGEIQIFTKVDGGSLTERMTIQQNGIVSLKSSGASLRLTSLDGVTEQSYIYNSIVGTKDFVIDSGVGSNASKGIAFRISGSDKLKIGSNGEIGIGGANYGNSGQAIVSNGSGSAVSWANVATTNNPTFTGTVSAGSRVNTQYVGVYNSAGSETISIVGQTAIGYFASVVQYSDDRIKTHEQTFSGETYINYVKQMVPKKYKKYNIILTKEEEELLEAGGDPFKDRRTGDPIKDSAFEPHIEYGVIAQEIHKISSLEDIVKVGKDNAKWGVDYSSINTITLGAVKGLIDKIEKLEARIKTLEGK